MSDIVLYLTTFNHQPVSQLEVISSPNLGMRKLKLREVHNLFKFT